MRSLVTAASLTLSWLAAVTDAVRAEDRDQSRAAVDARIAAAIGRLGAEEFSQREAASRALVSLGEDALAAVTEAGRWHGDVEGRRRARWIMRRIIEDARFSRSTDLEMVLLRGGFFAMGSPPSESDRGDDEQLHRVRISRSFFIGRYEVTQGQYERVTQQRPSWFCELGTGKEEVAGMETDELPVERVSWFDAIHFCNQLSQMDRLPPYYRIQNTKRVDGGITEAEVSVLGGHGYRLPSEAEWEFACRCMTTTPFSFGLNASGASGNFKWQARVGYGSRTTTRSLGRTAAKGSYGPNPWGVCDMHGNVAEWCWDFYDKDYYSRSPKIDPRGPAAGQHRVLRGGSWLLSQSSCRSAGRFWQLAGERSYVAGFRVARDTKHPLPSGE